MHIQSSQFAASSQVLQLFGSNGSGKALSASASYTSQTSGWNHFGPGRAVREALSAIFELVATDGNDAITHVATGNTFSRIDAGDGDDTVSVSVEGAARVSGGAGDDAISLTGARVRASGGSGDDAISVSGYRASASGGSGNDAIAVAGEHVGRVSGGSGDDAIGVAGRWVRSVHGGSGNDVITAAGQIIGRVSGGSGNDTITATGSRIGRVYGGDGDDTITVSGDRIGRISGGTGDDLINIDGDGALVAFRAGDGQDTVSITGRTEFAIFGERWGDDVMTLEDASFTFENGMLTVSFEGRDEKLTILAPGGGDLTLEMTSDRTFVVKPAT
jgi:hypothetical protein